MRAVGITGIQGYQKGMTNAPAEAGAPRLPSPPARPVLSIGRAGRRGRQGLEGGQAGNGRWLVSAHLEHTSRIQSPCMSSSSVQSRVQSQYSPVPPSACGEACGKLKSCESSTTRLNSTMLGARRPVNGDTESPVVVDASSVCAALAGAVCMQCPSLVRAGKGPGVAAPPSTRVA